MKIFLFCARILHQFDINIVIIIIIIIIIINIIIALFINGTICKIISILCGTMNQDIFLLQFMKHSLIFLE